MGAAALAGGCTTVTPIDRGGSDPVAGWNADTRALAQRSWLYAQLSSNAYLDYENIDAVGQAAGEGRHAAMRRRDGPDQVAQRAIGRFGDVGAHAGSVQ